MPTTNGHEVIPGCVLDGVFGWHNDARMIAVATDLGFELDVAGQRDVDAYDTGEYDNDGLAEIVHDIMREAEDWLNANTPACCFHCGKPVSLAPSGWWFHDSVEDKHACGVQAADHATVYVWMWENGDFMLTEVDDLDD